MHKWRSFTTSKFTPKVSGLKFSKTTNSLRSNFWKKIKWNSKIYPLGIMKTLLLYHLKPIWWQSIYKWRSFRASNFTHMLSGQKFFQVHKRTKIRFFQKKRKKKIGKYILGKNGNWLFFNLKQVSINSDENWPNCKSL